VAAVPASRSRPPPPPRQRAEPDKRSGRLSHARQSPSRARKRGRCTAPTTPLRMLAASPQVRPSDSPGRARFVGGRCRQLGSFRVAHLGRPRETCLADRHAAATVRRHRSDGEGARRPGATIMVTARCTPRLLLRPMFANSRRCARTPHSPPRNAGMLTRRQAKGLDRREGPTRIGGSRRTSSKGYPVSPPMAAPRDALALTAVGRLKDGP